MSQDIFPVESATPIQKPARPVRRAHWVKFGAIAALLTAGGSIAVGLWLGLTLLLDPNSLLWLNRFLPEWSQVPMALTNPLQTKAQIQLELDTQQQQLSLGAELAVAEDAVVMPIWQKLPECEGEQCQGIISLRLYFVQREGSGEPRYSLLNETRMGDTLAVFTQLQALAPQNGERAWLSLEGTNDKSDLTTGDRYGVMVYYNAQQRQLVEVLPWQSRAGRSPEWRNILGDATPEFVIDQSQNLEPEFAVYRLEQSPHFAGSPRLAPIELSKPALNLPAYQQAIALAEVKLWALAAQQLVEIKQTITNAEWTDAAEAQHQLIAYHAELTTQKCAETTLNIGQKIKHCLRAGDVNEALRLLQNNLDDPLVVMAVVTFLELNGKDLEVRLKALHDLDPFKEAVTLWQFLALTAQGGSTEAIANLRQQQQIDAPLQAKINDLLGHVEKTLSQQARPLNGNSKVMGQLMPLPSLRQADWLQPESSKQTLDPNQPWYRLEVTRYFDGRQWQQAPFKLPISNFVPGQSLWQLLGLEQDNRIYVANPSLTQGTAQQFGQVKAVQFTNGRLTLLVQAEQPNLNQGAIAYSDQTFRWLTPDGMTVQELATLESAWVETIVVNLWRHLRASDFRFELDPPPTAQLIEEFGAWQIQPIELTGNNHPEARVTLYLDAKRKLQNPDVLGNPSQTLTPYQLIFSDTGELLYSELSQDGAIKLQAIADLQDGGVAALLLRDQANRYSLRRWDATERTFKNL